VRSPGALARCARPVRLPGAVLRPDAVSPRRPRRRDDLRVRRDAVGGVQCHCAAILAPADGAVRARPEGRGPETPARPPPERERPRRP